MLEYVKEKEKIHCLHSCLFCSLTTAVTCGLSVIWSVSVSLRTYIEATRWTVEAAKDLHKEKYRGPRFEL